MTRQRNQLLMPLHLYSDIKGHLHPCVHICQSCTALFPHLTGYSHLPYPDVFPPGRAVKISLDVPAHYFLPLKDFTYTPLLINQSRLCFPCLVKMKSRTDLHKVSRCVWQLCKGGELGHEKGRADICLGQQLHYSALQCPPPPISFL